MFTEKNFEFYCSICIEERGWVKTQNTFDQLLIYWKIQVIRKVYKSQFFNFPFQLAINITLFWQITATNVFPQVLLLCTDTPRVVFDEEQTYIA